MTSKVQEPSAFHSESLKQVRPSSSIAHIISKSDSSGGEPVICHQIHTSWLPRMIRNHMYTNLYQAPCQLCLTASLLATDSISHEVQRFFTLVQPWRTSIYFWLPLRGCRPKSRSLPDRVEVIHPVVRPCTTFWLSSTRITLKQAHRLELWIRKRFLFWSKSVTLSM